MAKALLTSVDARGASGSYEMIVTDPPFDMSGGEIYESVCCSKHLVLISTMRQLLEFSSVMNDFVFCFDFVLNAVVPKKTMNKRMPHYTHCTCSYFRKKDTKSVFDRTSHQRDDVYKKGYWPTIIEAARNTSGGQYKKNESAMIDIISSFCVSEIYDPFCGTGSIPIAAAQCDNIEIIRANDIDKDKIASLEKKIRFFGCIK